MSDRLYLPGRRGWFFLEEILPVLDRAGYYVFTKDLVLVCYAGQEIEGLEPRDNQKDT